MNVAYSTRQVPESDRSVGALRAIGRNFHRRGWSLGTSSNYSVVLGRDPLTLLVTASGKHKDRLGRHDFVCVDRDGQSLASDAPRASAETLLHCVLAEQPSVGAVLHTHSIWSTILSDTYFPQRVVALSGFEMLKGLAGIDTHESVARLAIFENTQDIPALAEQVRQRIHDPLDPIRHGFLIRRHGLYTWGRDLEEARRHVEIIEFLLECVGRQTGLSPHPV